MGRTLRQVPLDFNWPIGQLWKGYLNPYSYHECKSCDGAGYNPETDAIMAQWYGVGPENWIWVTESRRYNDNAWQYHLDQDDVDALLAEDMLWDFTRVPLTEEQKEFEEARREHGDGGWMPMDNGYYPTAEEVNAWAIDNAMGHGGSSARYICGIAKAKRLGVYGLCIYCDGKGALFCDPKFEKLNDEWEGIDPPSGEGFQLWETTSEGSPQSPVFETIELLCEWLEQTNASTFGSETATKEQWLKMLKEDFVHHTDGNMTFI